MYKDSDPVSSPLTIKDLPLVACSPVGKADVVAGPEVVGRGVSKLATGGVGREGSGVEGVLLPG
jgi:hypothetical protein